MSGIHETAAWQRLRDHVREIEALHLRDLLGDSDRCAGLVTEQNGFMLDFSRQRVTNHTMDLLYDLAEAANLEQKKAAMAAGEKINGTEDRAVLHVALRAPRDKAYTVDGDNVVPAVHYVLDRVAEFSDQVRSGRWLGATGKQLKNVIAVGIGGSYLGPEFVFEALKTDPQAHQEATGRTLRFLANVDPADVARAIDGLNPETTLVVVISKTFTTAETMLNAKTLRQWLYDGMPSVQKPAVIRQHFIAVSASVDLATKFGIDTDNVFPFWDWVGGRYSVCSAVGVMPLSLQYGFPVVQQFLAGAHSMDEHFFGAPLRDNLPVILGLLGVWNSTFLNYSARAILPYAQPLLRFPAHIQQVDMESNGKRVGMDGTVLPYSTGPVNFGEPGTNGQHSFYQLLHQGRVVPCEFIGLCESPFPKTVAGEPVSNHDELMSNFFAQPDALAVGKTAAELEAEGVPEHLRPHKEFPGNRPSLSLLLPRLDAYTCGQLLALYEHRTAVEGFIWGLNSFDQWGVELGKVLAKNVRQQLQATRTSGAAIQGFNSSTTTLLQKYLSHSAGK